MTLKKRIGELEAIIDGVSRLRLGHLPTPLEPLSRFSEWLQGPSVYVKRDDATGFGQGGNKIRALEFILPEVISSGADLLLTSGVIQSNSVRQVAAAAAKIGLACHYAMIADRVEMMDSDYGSTGNIFLNNLYGATCEPVSIKDNNSRVLEKMADRFRTKGKKPYIVPYGCANLLGSIGYLNAALEIAQQIASREIEITHLVHASGTGGTQAGLIVGFAYLGLPIKVIGIDIDADAEGVRSRVTGILRILAEFIGLESDPLLDRIIIEPGYSAGAYGRADKATVEAITFSSKLEALTVDPVYSGKALAGVIGLSRSGYFNTHDGIIFLHTGGTPAIYAYRSLFDT